MIKTTKEIECEKCEERISERKSAHIGPFIEIPTHETKRAFLCGSCALCFPYLLPRKGNTITLKRVVWLGAES